MSHGDNFGVSPQDYYAKVTNFSTQNKVLNRIKVVSNYFHYRSKILSFQHLGCNISDLQIICLLIVILWPFLLHSRKHNGNDTIILCSHVFPVYRLFVELNFIVNVFLTFFSKKRSSKNERYQPWFS